MKICLAYPQRLGDIIRILPIARHFAADGNKVLVECLPPYHEFFDCVSYCRPSLRAERDAHRFDVVLDLEIWPTRFNEFVASGKTWLDFVYGSSPMLAGIDRKPVFDLIDEMPGLADYGLPADANIFSPFGYSQRDRYTLKSLAEEAKKRICGPFVTLADPIHADALSRAGISRNSILTAHRSSHLPRLLRDAKNVFTINSAPSIICGAVRSEFWHVLGGDPQNDAISPASRIVTFGL
jgi:hypothetical protein